ncbi:potassium channel family protein [Alkalihalobacterium sp. APHAB7]|uniref:potassium channel family protein n=1 Tax=Alkalihalobacterium sp. APHAB7 TaxID=3402081 RepID=UPI003AAA4CA0
MISFLLTVKRMVKAVINASKDKEFQTLLFFTILTFISGTIFYSQVEGMRVIDAFYFSVMTLTTVGFGDFAPQTDFGKLFTVVYTLVGIGLILGFINKIALNIKPSKTITKQIKKRRNATGSEINQEN